MRRIALLLALVGCDADPARMRAYSYANDSALPTTTLGLAAATGEGVVVAVDDCFGRTLPPGGSCTVTVRLADDQTTGTLTIGDRTALVAADD